MRKIMVTGSGGFIGRAVVAEILSRGDEVVEFNLPDHDITVYYAVRTLLEGCDSVIHLAGVLGTHELFDTPHLAVDVNVHGALNVLEACRLHDVGFVGITMPQVFPSVYTATKVAATRLATAYHHSFGVRVSHVRAFNAFGPGQAFGPGHPQKIIPTFSYHGWHGLPVPIWGDGQQGVDLIHTSDLARMLVDATEFGDDEVFDGGTGIPFTVNAVVNMVEAVTGPVKRDYLPMRRGENPTAIVATGEGWDLLGWKPSFDFYDLQETVNWYKDYEPK